MRPPTQPVVGCCRGSGVSSPFADVAGALACVVPTDVDIHVSVSRVAIIVVLSRMLPPLRGTITKCGLISVSSFL